MIITIQFCRISIPHPQGIPPPPKLSPLETISFSKSVSQYLFCKEVHCVLFYFLFIYLFIYCLFVFSRASLAAHGGSQARGQIGAVAAGLRQSHSNVGSEPSLPPPPKLRATPDL